MIEVKELRKNFNNLQVLKGIDISVKSGEIVAIAGASGAGKTTLLQIMGTLDKADSGSIRINDTDLSKFKTKQLAQFRNKNIGFVFQFHHLLPEFTALENICIPGWIAKLKDKDVDVRAKELLEYLGILERMHHKPSELSGGEQQRVAVARALINNPSIIFADEPSGNLDSQSAANLHDLFFDLREKFGQTFVIVTHNEELAARSDRKLWIKDGVIE